MSHSAHFSFHRLCYKRPIPTSRGELTSMPTFFLRLSRRQTPEKAGWGECAPIPLLSVDDRPDYQSKVQMICQQINAGAAPDSLDLDETPSVAFGLEMALLDLENGGRQRLFASDFLRGKPLATHGLIWMDTIDGVLKQVETKLEQGYRVLKMKVGALPLQQEYGILQAVRRYHAERDVEIRLDANGAFSPEDALDVLHEFAAFDIAFLEQPIRAGQWDAMAAICARSPIAIGLDEELIGVSAALRRSLLDQIRPQHVILKPRLLGGFSACEGWMRVAEETGCTWWINSLLESNVGLNALCQWTAHWDDRRIHGLGTGQLYRNNIPSPLYLDGAMLRFSQDGAWDFTQIGGNSNP